MSLRLQNQIVIITIISFATSQVLKHFLSTIGFNIIGFDYIIWFFYFAILVVIVLINNKILISPLYFLGLLFVIFFLIINYFTSPYTSIKSYLIGSFITLIPILTFIINYNITLSKETLFLLLKYLLIAISIILFIYSLENIIADNKGIKVSSSIILKTGGFAGTLANINISLALFLYHLTRKRKYILVLIYSVIVILICVLLKSMISALIISLVYLQIFSRFGLKKIIIVLMLFLSTTVILTTNKKVKNKIELYKQYYLNTSGDNLTPRLVLYRESLNIAKDHFPFGSGQGTFGSFPVKLSYNKVYFDYEIYNKQGLGPKSKPSFIFDSHWASVIGEMGFICALIYILLFFYPTFLAINFLKTKNAKPYSFLIIVSILAILIESFALAIPYQISFILIYAGLSGILSRFLITLRDRTALH